MSGGVPPPIPPIYAPGYMRNINLHQYNIKAVTGLAEKFAWPQRDSNLRPSQCFGLARSQVRVLLWPADFSACSVWFTLRVAS